MKVAIIGASGKMGRWLVRQSIRRGYEIVAICRDASAGKLDEFKDQQGFTLMTAPVISNEAMLTKALAGCDAVVAIPISARKLKATDLVKSLVEATAANGIKRLAFTAGEVTVAPGENEAYTRRQKILLAIATPIMWLTPYSLTDMRKATALIKKQPDWDWTIVRAPTLTETPALGYRFCELSEVSSKHKLSREYYAACLLDCLGNSDYQRRTLTVVSAGA